VNNSKRGGVGGENIDRGRGKNGKKRGRTSSRVVFSLNDSIAEKREDDHRSGVRGSVSSKNGYFGGEKKGKTEKYSKR